ncbi:hypothetical protein H6G41_17560 [Tolypothrix sp. FACHB-123]|uniref:hypothetical protein n=1 Tax=Tolypothrix sp. FACHB-123 TaxID=2692868 RepID=UPI001684DD63|nr:hypothetical protein [Tolypothrix sp. FACHB-123]MBD2356410.1 hypothetical protein [Tolypothrix sp. FACHB-123]
MLKRLIQWLKNFFQGLFGGKSSRSSVRRDVPKEPPPQLSDTDLEFLFNELLEGVHQARGQAWAIKWLHNIEHRISTQRWVEWLRQLEERLLAAPTPNNELASRLVQLGDLGVGEVGDVAYDIGMQLLTRNQGEPIWEYAGPDTISASSLSESGSVSNAADPGDNPSEGDYQTVTLEQLFMMMQQDETLAEQIAQQIGLETKDPQVIIQALINQYHAANQGATEYSES